MKKVVFIERILLQYRVDFYCRLRDDLKKEGIDLNLIYGQGTPDELKRKDAANISWAYKVNNLYLPFDIVWQPCLSLIKDADLIIVDHANKSLIVYLLLIYRKIKLISKLAFYGHGTNMQMRSTHIFNKFKKILSVKCDWWFCYTAGAKSSMIEMGFPNEKMTVFENAIDTSHLTKMLNTFTEEDVSIVKNELKLGAGPIGIYCGALYKEKRISFLIEVCDRIRKKIPTFEMIIIGSGKEKEKVENAAKSRFWFHYIGPRFGIEKVKYFRISDIFMIPGAVGLAILDSFALRVPIITTRYSFHGPEIEYLENGINGIISEDSQNSYIEEVINLLKDPGKLAKLKSNCGKASEKYTIENMAELFSEGIRKCLEFN